MARRHGGWALAALLWAGCPGNEAGPAMRIDPALLYTQMCARCHGADGKGDPEMAKTMPVRDLTDPAFHARAGVEQIERVIMAGQNLMPAFGGTLSALKQQALAGYVKRMGK